MYEKRVFSANEAKYAEELRRKLEEAERLILRIVPGRERSLALTKLDEALFWANVAIAAGGISTRPNTRIPAEQAEKKTSPSIHEGEPSAREAEQVRAMAEAARKSFTVPKAPEPVISIKVPQEIRADRSFNVDDMIYRARAKAIRDFGNEMMEGTLSKLE